MSRKFFKALTPSLRQRIKSNYSAIISINKRLKKLTKGKKTKVNNYFIRKLINERLMCSKWKIPFIYMEHSQIKKNENTKKKPVLNFKSRDFTITPKLISNGIIIGLFFCGIFMLKVSVESHMDVQSAIESLLKNSSDRTAELIKGYPQNCDESKGGGEIFYRESTEVLLNKLEIEQKALLEVKNILEEKIPPFAKPKYRIVVAIIGSSLLVLGALSLSLVGIQV